jgi:glycosyltransferase involved in cell wall biosynthesis
VQRVAWSVRELSVPFETRGADVLFTPLGAAGLPLAARARRLPVVVVNFGLNLIWRRSSAVRRRFLRASLAAAARVICLADAQRDELIACADLDPQRVLSMTIPVDATFFRPEETPGSGGVLAVGKDLARDYATLFEAAAGGGWHTTVVAHPRNLQSGTAPPRTAIAHDLSFLELREAYACAGCVVLPQRGADYPYGSEGGGLTALLEAMAMGKAIVASDRAVLHDYVDDGVEALLVPPEDAAALREAIERVLGDPELAQRLGAAARARVERELTSPIFASRLAPVLRAVV